MNQFVTLVLLLWSVTTPGQRFHLQNIDAVGSVLSGDPSIFSYHSTGITGQAQLVGISDSGLDADICFFRDDDHSILQWPATNPDHRKVFTWQHYNMDTNKLQDSSGHGTHIAASVAGKSLSENTEYNGVAPDARLFVQVITDPSAPNSPFYPVGLQPIVLTDSYAAGCRVHLLSWHTGTIPTEYTIWEQEIDEFQWLHPAFLVISGGGSTGEEGIAVPGSSKNSLTVGATFNSGRLEVRERIDTLSNTGPTYDGRRKPDIVTPGQFVFSAVAGVECEVDLLPESVGGDASAASAAAVAAGAVLLLRQTLVEGWFPSGTKKASDGFEPTGALLKAILLHSANGTSGILRNSDVSNVPNNFQGFGRVTLSNFLFGESTQTSPTAVFDQQVVNHGEILFYCVTIPQQNSRLKVTMAFMDPPAVPMAKQARVNDLDLFIYTSDNQLLTANSLLSPAPPEGVWDTVNTVEQVVFTSSIPNERVTVGVRGRTVSVPHPSLNGQPYSLVFTITGDTDQSTTITTTALNITTNGEPTCAICFPELCNSHGRCALDNATNTTSSERKVSCTCDVGWDAWEWCTECTPNFVGENCAAPPPAISCLEQEQIIQQQRIGRIEVTKENYHTITNCSWVFMSRNPNIGIEVQLELQTMDIAATHYLELTDRGVACPTPPDQVVRFDEQQGSIVTVANVSGTNGAAVRLYFNAENTTVNRTNLGGWTANFVVRELCGNGMFCGCTRSCSDSDGVVQCSVGTLPVAASNNLCVADSTCDRSTGKCVCNEMNRDPGLPLGCQQCSASYVGVHCNSSSYTCINNHVVAITPLTLSGIINIQYTDIDQQQGLVCEWQFKLDDKHTHQIQLQWLTSDDPHDVSVVITDLLSPPSPTTQVKTTKVIPNNGTSIIHDAPANSDGLLLQITASSFTPLCRSFSYPIAISFSIKQGCSSLSCSVHADCVESSNDGTVSCVTKSITMTPSQTATVTHTTTILPTESTSQTPSNTISSSITVSHSRTTTSTSSPTSTTTSVGTSSTTPTHSVTRTSSWTSTPTRIYTPTFTLTETSTMTSPHTSSTSTTATGTSTQTALPTRTTTGATTTPTGSVAPTRSFTASQTSTGLGSPTTTMTTTKTYTDTPPLSKPRTQTSTPTLTSTASIESTLTNVLTTSFTLSSTPSIVNQSSISNNTTSDRGLGDEGTATALLTTSLSRTLTIPQTATMCNCTTTPSFTHSTSTDVTYTPPSPSITSETPTSIPTMSATSTVSSSGTSTSTMVPTLSGTSTPSSTSVPTPTSVPTATTTTTSSSTLIPTTTITATFTVTVLPTLTNSLTLTNTSVTSHNSGGAPTQQVLSRTHTPTSNNHHAPPSVPNSVPPPLTIPGTVRPSISTPSSAIPPPFPFVPPFFTPSPTAPSLAPPNPSSLAAPSTPRDASEGDPPSPTSLTNTLTATLSVTTIDVALQHFILGVPTSDICYLVELQPLSSSNKNGNPSIVTTSPSTTTTDINIINLREINYLATMNMLSRATNLPEDRVSILNVVISPFNTIIVHFEVHDFALFYSNLESVTNQLSVYFNNAATITTPFLLLNDQITDFVVVDGSFQVVNRVNGTIPPIESIFTVGKQQGGPSGLGGVPLGVVRGLPNTPIAPAAATTGILGGFGGALFSNTPTVVVIADDDDDDHGSGGSLGIALIAIIVGVSGGIALICCLLLYLAFVKKQQPQDAIELIELDKSPIIVFDKATTPPPIASTLITPVGTLVTKVQPPPKEQRWLIPINERPHQVGSPPPIGVTPNNNNSTKLCHPVLPPIGPTALTFDLDKVIVHEEWSTSSSGTSTPTTDHNSQFPPTAPLRISPRSPYRSKGGNTPTTTGFPHPVVFDRTRAFWDDVYSPFGNGGEPTATPIEHLLNQTSTATDGLPMATQNTYPILAVIGPATPTKGGPGNGVNGHVPPNDRSKSPPHVAAPLPTPHPPQHQHPSSLAAVSTDNGAPLFIYRPPSVTKELTVPTPSNSDSAYTSDDSRYSNWKD